MPIIIILNQLSYNHHIILNVMEFTIICLDKKTNYINFNLHA